MTANTPVLDFRSAPMAFAVTYPAPTIGAINPAVTATCSSGFLDLESYNLTITGQAFAPGSRVLMNDSARPS